MPRLYLVRHGRAAAGWNTDPNPGLDDIGRRQAAATAARLQPLGPLAVISSPLRRCQQTAAALATPWAVPVVVEPGVAEIPSPEGVAMADRVEWLREAMRGEWAALGPRYTAFRDGVVATLLGLTADTVVFSHFVAINAAIGAALGDDRLVIRSLDNASVTVIDVVADPGATETGAVLQLVEGGAEADTLIR
jgi:broad specificity phosphatase PhoE